MIFSIRLWVDLDVASGCFMLRINPSFIGNLTQVQVLFYLATSQEMVRKRSFKVREKSGNFTQSQRKFIFFREVRENTFLTNSST